MKFKSIFILLLCLMLLCGCNPREAEPTTPSPTGEYPTLPTGPVTSGAYVTVAPADLFSNRDYETVYEASEAVKITLNGTSVAAGNGVTVSGSTATITDEGVYVLSGSLSDGMIIVDAGKKDKVQIVLSAASIHSVACAAIYVRQADKVFITTAPGTENTLSNGGSFTALDGNDIDGVVFSKDDVTFNGGGTLTVNSPAGHGIVSKDELTFTSGTYYVTADAHGIVGKDNVCIDGASVTVQSGKDGIRSKNDDDASLGFVYIKSGTFDLTSQGDGISASHFLQIDGGSFRLFGNAAITNDAPSTKSLKASGNLVINGGVFSIDTTDDAIHGNQNVIITSGNFDISSGDDAVHADAALTVTGGALQVNTCYEGLEALSVTIEGGDHSFVCTDDGINAAGGADGSGVGGHRPGGDKFHGGNADSFITISGGTVYIHAGGDGIDSNGYLTISGGHTTVCGPTRGDTAVLDFGISGSITGGTFVGTGSYMMAQTFTSSENQGVISLSVGNQPAGTSVTVTDGQGNVLMSAAPEENFAIVILSCPQLHKGERYTVTVGTLTDTFEAS